jgi:hypothetical protein
MMNDKWDVHPLMYLIALMFVVDFLFSSLH